MHIAQRTMLPTLSVLCMPHNSGVNERNMTVTYHCQTTQLLCHTACSQRWDQSTHVSVATHISTLMLPAAWTQTLPELKFKVKFKHLCSHLCSQLHI